MGEVRASDFYQRHLGLAADPADTCRRGPVAVEYVWKSITGEHVADLTAGS